jgi:hypothetical protein
MSSIPRASALSAAALDQIGIARPLTCALASIFPGSLASAGTWKSTRIALVNRDDMIEGA